MDSLIVYRIVLVQSIILWNYFGPLVFTSSVSVGEIPFLNIYLFFFISFIDIYDNCFHLWRSLI